MKIDRVKDLAEFNEKHPHIAREGVGEANDIINIVSARFRAVLPYEEQLLSNLLINKLEIRNNKKYGISR